MKKKLFLLMQRGVNNKSPMKWLMDSNKDQNERSKNVYEKGLV